MHTTESALPWVNASRIAFAILYRRTIHMHTPKILTESPEKMKGGDTHVILEQLLLPVLRHDLG